MIDARVECRNMNGINILTTQVTIPVRRRLIVEDNEMRAWRAWKITCCTVLVLALLVTAVHIVAGV